MRKGFALVVAALGAAVLLATSGPAASRPSGATVTHKPVAGVAFAGAVTVKGKYFKSAEKLKVTLSSSTVSKTWTKQAKATKTGTFSVSFGHIALGPTDQYTLKVVGSMMSRSTIVHKPTVTHKPVADVAFGAEVTVKGKYFKSAEKLTVTLSSSTIAQTWTKQATATKTGTFSVSFGHIALSSCNQYTLKVVGSMKSRSTTSHDLVPC